MVKAEGISFMRTYTEEQITNWPSAVLKYNLIMKENSTVRVHSMSAKDRGKFAAIHNVASDETEHILAFMVRWGGFRELVNSGIFSNYSSDLFDRLLDGGEPLQFPPPRCFGRPWYDVFDFPDLFFECRVKFGGQSRRHRDKGKDINLLLVNDCLWSCSNQAESGNSSELFELNSRWIAGGSRDDLWREACVLLSGEEVRISLSFGLWPNEFELILVVRDALLERDHIGLASEATNMFAVIDAHPNVQWLLKNNQRQS